MIHSAKIHFFLQLQLLLTENIDIVDKKARGTYSSPAVSAGAEVEEMSNQSEVSDLSDLSDPSDPSDPSDLPCSPAVLLR